MFDRYKGYSSASFSSREENDCVLIQVNDSVLSSDQENVAQSRKAPVPVDNPILYATSASSSQTWAPKEIRSGMRIFPHYLRRFITTI